jgi:hypothetical protein
MYFRSRHLVKRLASCPSFSIFVGGILKTGGDVSKHAVLTTEVMLTRNASNPFCSYRNRPKSVTPDIEIFTSAPFTVHGFDVMLHSISSPRAEGASTPLPWRGDAIRQIHAQPWSLTACPAVYRRVHAVYGRALPTAARI